MIKIGDKEFKFKKDALNYYKSILNSYNFEDSLSDHHFNDLIDLIDYDFSLSSIENEDNEYVVNNINKVDIIDIKIAKVQFGARCFDVIYSDYSNRYISYIQMINQPVNNPGNQFNIACRSAIREDMRNIKKKYFFENAKNGFVKCQETKELSKWEELAVDHRQPNTFSVIVDRFKELNQIDVNKIEYTTNEINISFFKDESISESFRKYHKDKANLRIVRKECNLSRTGMARIKRTNNDLTIK